MTLWGSAGFLGGGYIGVILGLYWGSRFGAQSALSEGVSERIKVSKGVTIPNRKPQEP